MWAAEVNPRGVRVNGIAAGPVFSSQEMGPLIEQLDWSAVLGRAAQVEEIADVIAVLASEGAGYVTGPIFAVDVGRAAV